MQFHFSSQTNLLEKKGVFQQENTELQIGPQLFFEEVASNITPLIAEEEGINRGYRELLDGRLRGQIVTMYLKK